MSLVKKDSTDRSEYFYIVEDVGGTNPGEPKTGLAAANITSISYVRPLEARADGTGGAGVSDLAAVTTAHTDGGMKEIDATNMAGVYRFDFADAAYATGKSEVDLFVQVAGAANAIARPIKHQLVSFDPDDAVRLALTALPPAAADAAGGLPISDAGGLDLDARLDAAVSSRMPSTEDGSSFTAIASVGSVTGAVGSVTGSVGSVTGAVGSVTGAVGSVAGNVDGNVTGSVGSLAAQAKADVNAEVDGALNTAIPVSPTADSINERIKTLDDDWADAGRLDVILDARASQASVDTVDGNVDLILADTGTDGVVVASIAAGAITATAIAADAIGASELAADAANEIADAILTRQMTEAYAADGTAMTPAQAFFQIWARLAETSFSGVTGTAKKLDGSTAAMTFTVDNAATPTSITRAT